MRAETKVILLSLVAGALGWVAHAIIAYLFLYDAPFWSVLILGPSLDELYLRLFEFAVFLLLGILASWIIGRRRVEKIQTVLFRISQATSTSGDLSELLRTIHQQLGTLIDTTNFYVALYDEKSGLYSFPYWADEYDRSEDYTPQQLRKSLTDYVRRTGKPLLADEKVHAQLMQQGEVEMVGTSSPIWLGAPLKIAGGIIGVVAVQSYQHKSLYSARDLELLAFVSEHIAQAVEHKRAEQEIHRLEHFLEGVIDNTTMWLAVLDEQANIILWNKAAEEITGYSRAEVLGNSQIWTWLYPDEKYRQEVMALASSIIEGGKLVEEQETTIRSRDGRDKVIAWSARGLVKEGGSPTGLIATGRDVTGSKQTANRQAITYRIAQAASKSANLDDLLQYIHQGLGEVLDTRNFYIALYDAQTDTVEFTYFVDETRPDYLPLTRRSRRPRKGLTEYVMNRGEALLFRDHEIKQLAERGEIEIIGSLPAAWLGAPLRTAEKIIGALAVQNYADPAAYTEDDRQILAFASSQIANLIERRRAEEALRESETRYRSPFEDSPISLWEQDFSDVKAYLDGLQASGVGDLRAYFASHPEAVAECANKVKIIDVNKATLKLYSAGSKEELFLGLGRIFCAESYDFFREQLLLIAQGKTEHDIETVNQTLGGEKKHLALNWKVAPGYEGTLSKVLISLVDITDRKRAEEAQQRLQQQERPAAVGQLAAGIAHDFNNLLTGIIGLAELTLITPGLPHQVRSDMKAIVQQGQRGAHLVRQVLDFSRKSISFQAPLDLIPFLREVSQLLQRTIPENIHLDLQIEPGKHVIYGDPTQIQQALTNLVVNARDAMLEGGKLSLRLGRLQIAPSEAAPLPDMPPGDWVVLTVSDTGSGIPPEVRSHLFEPFFTTKPVGQGVGLGLAQVYGIVKQHNGHIGVKTELGKGTTFTIYLPAL